MKEKQVVRTIQRIVANQKGLAIKLVGSGYQHAGLPDLLVLTPNGACFFIEVKVKKAKTLTKPFALLSERQKATCDKLSLYAPVLVAINTSDNRIHWFLYPIEQEITCDSYHKILKGGKKCIE